MYSYVCHDSFICLICFTHQHKHTCTHQHKHNTTHCNTLQHTATHCNTLQHTATTHMYTSEAARQKQRHDRLRKVSCWVAILQTWRSHEPVTPALLRTESVETPCSQRCVAATATFLQQKTLQHTATATRRISGNSRRQKVCGLQSQHTAIHCNTLEHNATQCNRLQHTATHCNTLQRTVTHCNALQHTATATRRIFGNSQQQQVCGCNCL